MSVEWRVRARGAVSRRRSILIAYGVLCLLLIAAVAVSPSFASSDEAATVATQASFIALVGIGQTFVIIGGGIDLSVSAVISSSAVLLSSAAHGSNAALAWVLPLILALAICVGLINGIGVAAGVSPIIMTLGVEGVVAGVLLLYTKGTAPSAAPPSDIVWLSTHRWGPLPVDVVLWAVLGLLAGFVLTKTVFGRRLYATGSSGTVAEFSGVTVTAVRVGSYVVSAVCAAIAGVVISGYVGTAYLTLGDTFLFSSITAVVIGGASILGGSGRYAGTVAGALTLTVLASLLTILNLTEGYLEIIYGAVILCAVGVAMNRSQ